MAGRIKGQGSKWCRPSTRIAIYLRDGFACAYCGQSAEDGAKLTLDHVVACELGGDNAPTNLVTACLSCNSSKRDMTTREWFARLRDDGVDTGKLGPKIRRQTSKKLDRATALELLANRSN